MILAACGGGESTTPQKSSYSIGGTISGLIGNVTLAINSTGNLVINENGQFSFANKLIEGSSYQVSITSQPDDQVCTITSGNSGIASSSSVSALSINCEKLTYTVGGFVSGLVGDMRLSLNNAETITVTNDGQFSFANKLESGANYEISITNQPIGQTCLIEVGGSGISNLNSTSAISIKCVINLVIDTSVAYRTASFLLIEHQPSLETPISVTFSNGDTLTAVTISANSSGIFLPKLSAGLERIQFDFGDFHQEIDIEIQSDAIIENAQQYVLDYIDQAILEMEQFTLDPTFPEEQSSISNEVAKLKQQRGEITNIDSNAIEWLAQALFQIESLEQEENKSSIANSNIRSKNLVSAYYRKDLPENCNVFNFVSNNIWISKLIGIMVGSGAATYFAGPTAPAFATLTVLSAYKLKVALKKQDLTLTDILRECVYPEKIISEISDFFSLNALKYNKKEYHSKGSNNVLQTALLIGQPYTFKIQIQNSLFDEVSVAISNFNTYAISIVDSLPGFLNAPLQRLIDKIAEPSGYEADVFNENLEISDDLSDLDFTREDVTSGQVNLTFSYTGQLTESIPFKLTFTDKQSGLATQIDALITLGIPEVEDQTFSVNKNSQLTGMLTANFAQNYDIVSQPLHGTVELQDVTTGAFLYTPNSEYIGDDSFTFKASNYIGESNIATVNIIINEAQCLNLDNVDYITSLDENSQDYSWGGFTFSPKQNDDGRWVGVKLRFFVEKEESIDEKDYEPIKDSGCWFSLPVYFKTIVWGSFGSEYFYTNVKAPNGFYYSAINKYQQLNKITAQVEYTQLYGVFFNDDGSVSNPWNGPTTGYYESGVVEYIYTYQAVQKVNGTWESHRAGLNETYDQEGNLLTSSPLVVKQNVDGSWIAALEGNYLYYNHLFNYIQSTPYVATLDELTGVWDSYSEGEATTYRRDRDSEVVLSRRFYVSLINLDGSRISVEEGRAELFWESTNSFQRLTNYVAHLNETGIWQSMVEGDLIEYPETGDGSIKTIFIVKVNQDGSLISLRSSKESFSGDIRKYFIPYVAYLNESGIWEAFIEGKVLTWYASGVLASEAVYEKGVLIRICNYNEDGSLKSCSP